MKHREIKVKHIDAVRIDGEAWSIVVHEKWDEVLEEHVPTGTYYLSYLESDDYLTLDLPTLETMTNILTERNK